MPCASPFDGQDREIEDALMAHHRRVEEIVEQYLEDCPKAMQAKYERECARFDRKVKAIKEKHGLP